MAVTDVELVDQALAGSQSAFTELARRYAGPAVNLAARMVQDRALAEDLAQDAFARAFSRLASYDREHKFSSWFFQILHNVTVDHLRRKRVKTSSLDEMEAAGAPLMPVAREAGPAAQAEQAALGLALQDAIGRLRPEYREVVILRYREDLSVQEIAEITGLPAGTVKTHLFRARKELAAILSPQGWGESPAADVETPRGSHP